MGVGVLGQVDGVHHLRATPRFKLFQPSEMTSGSTPPTRVHILNLSTGGALLYAAAPPRPGTPLRLRCGDEMRTARVAWAEQRRFGVAFTTPLADGKVTQVIAEQEASVAAARRRVEQDRLRA